SCATARCPRTSCRRWRRRRPRRSEGGPGAVGRRDGPVSRGRGGPLHSAAMLAAQFLAAVERLAPTALAEDWDNVGLLVGRHNQPVRRALVALELRDEVLGEARGHGCGLVLTHHPPSFPALAALTEAAPGREP